MNESREYQYNFSGKSGAMFDVAARQQKAKTMVAVLEDFTGGALDTLDLLNDGGSTGIIDEYLSRHVKSVVGIDIDEAAIHYAQQHFSSRTLSFQLADALALPFPDNHFDVVVSSHVYEHVPDSQIMMNEIYRVLKPSGLCYFAASNRLRWNEPHYHLPLLSVMPKWMAHRYMRITKRGDSYYENHLTYWGLKRLVRQFQVHDYTRAIIQDPERFCADYMIKPGSFTAKAARAIATLAPWLMPSYIWVLEKPAS